VLLIYMPRYGTKKMIARVVPQEKIDVTPLVKDGEWGILRTKPDQFGVRDFSVLT